MSVRIMNSVAIMNSPRHQRARKRAARPGMGAQQGKRVVVTARKQRLQGLPRRFQVRPQMSFAYSPIARSEENQPM